MNPADKEQFDRILLTRFQEETAARLSRYYQFVMKWNPRLHLTTISEPRDFFERHIVESSLVAEKIASEVDQVWDIGSGAGIPGLIVAILQPSLSVRLVEASRKKAIFLEEAVAELTLRNVTVVPRRFELMESLPETSCMTVRAIEEMERMIPALVRLGSGGLQMIFLGANSLEDAIRSNLTEDWFTESSILPGSDRRFLIQFQRST